MPPRSVCLNVFTSSLGSGIPKEALGISVRDVSPGRNTDAKSKDGAVVERTRQDSVQGSPNDMIASHADDDSSHTSPSSTSDIDMSSFPEEMARSATNSLLSAPTSTSTPSFHNFNTPPACSTCAQPPVPGSPLQRCSRCKSAYYCSKPCQKAAWKLHKLSCRGGVGAGDMVGTPNISTPGSPVQRVVGGEGIGGFEIGLTGRGE